MLELERVLLWCVGINYGILLLWFGLFAFAHEGLYRLHQRWFALPRETFDALNWMGMAIYKLSIFLLNLVPLTALYLATLGK
jgi:hypothetical protein